MSTSPEIAISGAITVTALANIRQGVPTRSAPVLRKVAQGTGLPVTALTIGDSVQNNAHWYRIDQNSFIWAGACSPLMPSPHNSAADVEAGGIQTNSAAVATLKAPLQPNVVDIYHADNVTSFVEARNAGIWGVIHKATTGATGRDDAYARRRDQALEAGMLWGAYHWGTAANPIAQVDNFLEVARPNDHTLVALDFERDVGNQMSLQGARIFLRELTDRLGRRPVIYSGNTIKEALGSEEDEFFGKHRLWLAQYGPRPKVQASWESCWLWQFTGGAIGDPNRSSVPGMPGNAKSELDCNLYNGSRLQLEAEWAS